MGHQSEYMLLRLCTDPRASDIYKQGKRSVRAYHKTPQLIEMGVCSESSTCVGDIELPPITPKDTKYT